MLPENAPPPVPLLVFVARATVGLADVLQITPLAVTPVIQLPVIFPPDDAVVVVIADMAVVVIVGRTVAVVKVS